MSHTLWQTIILSLPLCHITLDSCCFTKIHENQRSLPSSVAFQAELHTVDALGIASSKGLALLFVKWQNMVKHYSVTSFGKLDWKSRSPQWWSSPICLNTLQELSLLRGKGGSSTSKVLAMWKPAILCTYVKCACSGTCILCTGKAETGLSRLSGHHSRPTGQLQVSWENLSQRVMWSVIKEDSTREKESPAHLPLNQSEMEASMPVPSLAVMTEESEDCQFNLAWCFPRNLEIMRNTPSVFLSAAVFPRLLRCNTSEFLLIRYMLYLSNYYQLLCMSLQLFYYCMTYDFA